MWWGSFRFWCYLDNWDNALDKINDGKEVHHTDTQIPFQLLGYMRAYFHLPYRQTEGVVRAHAGKEILSIPDSVH